MAVVKYLYPIAIASLFLVLSCAALELRAEPAAEVTNSRLSQLLDGIEGFRHPFVQQVYGANGLLQETSEGEIGIRPPDVRWEISTPFPQTILLQGNELRVYDPDLEQITVRDIGDGWSDVPIALLVNGAVLTDYFDVIEISAQVFSLQPLDATSLIREIRLEWDGASLDSIQIYDHTEQLIVVQFEHQSIPEVLQSDYFEMAIPPGTEVVRG